MKIKKGDQVFIICGKDKGRKGKVFRALPAKEQILVEGINMIKKHVRPKKSGEKGKIVAFPLPISVSNVKLICPKCKKAIKAGYKIIGKKKNRICKKCAEKI